MSLSRFILAAEFLLLCVALPTVIIVYRLAPHMFIFLWGATAYCALVLWFRHRHIWPEVWNWGAVTWHNLKPIFLRWVAGCVVMTIFLYFVDPSRMFELVQERPRLVVFLLLLYPLLSALPQEFIFCSFFFERYKPFFKTGWPMIFASAVVFAYAHVLFINWVAPLLSFIAGLIFAETYARHKSLALVTIEHGLYGNYLFVVGLGWYFYGGAVTQ